MDSSKQPPDFLTRHISPMSAGERRLSKFALMLENVIKVPLFGCQRCGECILSSTAFVCSQRCPKQLRNGPCGGTASNGSCEVFPDQKCVWYQIYYRSRRWQRVSLLFKLNRIHNWNLEGTSAWLNVFKKRASSIILRVPNDKQKVKELTSHDT